MLLVPALSLSLSLSLSLFLSATLDEQIDHKITKGKILSLSISSHYLWPGFVWRERSLHCEELFY